MPISRSTWSAPTLTSADQGEHQLVVAARNGSPDAIAALYKQYAASLMRLLRPLTGSSHDAEDVVHDLFLGLPESLRSYEHRGELHAWLRAVAVRIALMKMRAARRRDRRATDVSEGERVAAPQADPWNAADLEVAIARLPESLRVVVVLRQIEDRSHDEIAEILGIKVGAVRVRYVRALARLRSFLEDGS